MVLKERVETKGSAEKVRMECHPDGVIETVTEAQYTIQQALGELGDNAGDALAKFFHISAEDDAEGELCRIICADNGKGMDDVDLKNALNMGFQKLRQPHDIGLRAFGLNAAMFTVGNKATILTRTADGSVICARLDRQEIRETENWDLIVEPCKDLLDLWDSHKVCPGSGTGTVIIMEDLNANFKNAKGFIGNPGKGIRHVQGLPTRYSKWISNGKFKMFTSHNQSKWRELHAHDPLSLGDEQTNVLIRDEVMRYGPVGNDVFFHLSLVTVPEGSSKNYGCYVYVADLMISRDESFFGLVTDGAASHHWRTRAEARFSTVEDLLKVACVQTNKHNLQWNGSSLADTLRNLPFGTQLRKAANDRQRIAKQEAAAARIAKREKGHTDFLTNLKSKPSITGGGKEASKLLSNITSIETRGLADVSKPSEICNGVLCINHTNHKIMELLRDNAGSTKHQVARAIGLLSAFPDPEGPTAENFQDYKKFVINVLAELV
jgi:hypothetical protein